VCSLFAKDPEEVATVEAQVKKTRQRARLGRGKGSPGPGKAAELLMTARFIWKLALQRRLGSKRWGFPGKLPREHLARRQQPCARRDRREKESLVEQALSAGLEVHAAQLQRPDPWQPDKFAGGGSEFPGLYPTFLQRWDLELTLC
jgi:hypothetical protein